jgi:hypothetical protein
LLNTILQFCPSKRIMKEDRKKKKDFLFKAWYQECSLYVQWHAGNPEFSLDPRAFSLARWSLLILTGQLVEPSIKERGRNGLNGYPNSKNIHDV